MELIRYRISTFLIVGFMWLGAPLLPLFTLAHFADTPHRNKVIHLEGYPTHQRWDSYRTGKWYARRTVHTVEFYLEGYTLECSEASWGESPVVQAIHEDEYLELGMQKGIFPGVYHIVEASTPRKQLIDFEDSRQAHHVLTGFFSFTSALMIGGFSMSLYQLATHEEKFLDEMWNPPA